MKIKIDKGHTNISYREGDVFVQQKMRNGFNHGIDYSLLKQFDFVPKLIENEFNTIKWEFIEGYEPQINFDNIELIAKQIKIIHNSKLKFPKNNIAARIKSYRKTFNELKQNVPVLNDFYRSINQTLAKMDRSTPLHNDLWPFNMIENNGKIYFVDWEYATMGDKHFELAYIIESSNMSKDLEQKFLEAYGEYNPLFLLRHKMLVNYIVILWVHTQTPAPFNTEMYQQRIYDYAIELKKMTGN
ncbi:phosphotransferase system PTS lichenan IIa component [Mycoplasmopsis bovigenitalium]|uniref:Phosphotransferase system PTS, lichenan-specific IIa component n=1 Tax=Mycoplasmopsis bovigenitalium 51080 TaxID=1188235 RepID=N9VF39_9BACT|nr:phosphotransferase [Mycoplasmopsis bovigenitalium]ENY70223.1 Phosphotransferase system PTS, lichenan-specific IIa component [Mycoplasmopsis bovigenitalium 51080]BAW18156.1 phosphotransferase system PTS lichenan IIa component [Mycoplasmopsis bovigenitalium]